MRYLATLEQAKTHLGLDGTCEHDDNLLMKLEEATALCLDYVKNYVGTSEDRLLRYAEIDAWTPNTAPVQMRAAVLRMVGHLVRFRGDDDRTVAPVIEHQSFPSDVAMLLKRLRDPSIA